MSDYQRKSDTHPLPLLTAIGNEGNGGDYKSNVHINDVGSWANDVISVEDEAPNNYVVSNIYFKAEGEEKMSELNSTEKARNRIVEAMYTDINNINNIISEEYLKLSKEDMHKILGTLIQTIKDNQPKEVMNSIMRATAGELLFNEFGDPNEMNSEYVVPEGTTSIDKHFFRGCTFIEKVTIPDSVSFIDDRAFNECFCDDVVIRCNSDSYAADFARAHDIYREYTDLKYNENAVNEYIELSGDFTSADFQSGELGCGYPIMLCVNTAEQYAYCAPVDYYEKEFKTAYIKAYEDCVIFGRKPCYNYEDFNSLAKSLANSDDFYNNLEETENGALDVCFAYANEDIEEDNSLDGDTPKR